VLGRRDVLDESARDAKRALVDALLDVPVMQEADGRALVLTELADCGYRLDAKRSSRDRLDIWEIVTACLRQRGALTALADILQGIEGEHMAVNRISPLVDQLEADQSPPARTGPIEPTITNMKGNRPVAPSVDLANWEPSGAFPDVHRERLFCGDELGAGARGRVFELLDNPGFVYKEYISPDVNGGALADLILLRNIFSEAESRMLGSSASWPIARVVRGEHIIGCIMPKIPGEFTVSLPAGTRPAYLTYLCYPPRPAWDNIKLPSVPERMEISNQILDLFDFLQRHSLVVGDISAQNLLWTCNPTSRILLLGCDGIRKFGASSALPEGQTPNWHDPLLGSRRPDFDSDNYKAALIVGRILSQDPHVRPGEPLKMLEGVPRAVAREVADCFAGAARPPGERPAVGEWKEALAARDVIQIIPPTLPEHGHRVLPLYVMCDVTDSSDEHGSSAESSLDRTWTLIKDLTEKFRNLAYDPVESQIARICIVTYCDDAEVLVPLSEPDIAIPQLIAGTGDRRYGPAFRLVKDLIERDMRSLKAEGQEFLPGRIFFISGGAPTDDWESDYGKLVDCDVEIFTWATGDAEEARVEEIAGEPERDFSNSTFSPAALLGEYMRTTVGSLSDDERTSSLVVLAEGQTHVFHADFTVGRQGNLTISDDYASSRHALFRYAQGGWHVEDLGSTNGTWLNGRRVYADQRLRKGDKIKIGRTTILVVSTTRDRPPGLGWQTWLRRKRPRP
jgi:uncharacterized protein YegL